MQTSNRLLNVIIKQRKVELKKYQAEVESLEKGKKQTRLLYERSRQEFLQKLKTKREKWWKSDEIFREYLNKDINAFFRKLDEQDQLERVKQLAAIEKANNKKKPSNNRFNNKYTSTSLIDFKSTKSSFHRKNDSPSADSQSSHNALTSNSRFPRLIQRSHSFSSSTNDDYDDNDQNEQNRTAWARVNPGKFPNVNLTKPMLKPANNTFNLIREKEKHSLSLILNRFLINTPQMVENAKHTKTDDTLAERIIEFKKEKENTLKKDLRYYDLVGLLYESKL